MRFIKDKFHIESKVVGNLTLKKIVDELTGGKCVIASVSHKIRNPDDPPQIKGGHLVLILGYDLEKGFFVFHNPSGNTISNQKYAQISFDKFEKFFAGRGITVNI